MHDKLPMAVAIALAALPAFLLLHAAPVPADEPAAAPQADHTQESAEEKPPLPRDVDHFLTGFPLRGAHIDVPCESCHARGILQGTPRLCSRCHQNAGPVRASAKPLSHIVTRAECDRCHTERSWLGARFVHTADTATRCFSCHNGRAAEGKSRDHIPAPNTCQDCHNTRTWSLN